MKKRCLGIAAFLLSLLLLILPLASCASTGEPLLTLEVDGKTYTYSVNLYELYLSAIKGNHVASGNTAGGASPVSSKYWDTIELLDGKRQTVNDYTLAEALKESRLALVGIYLFDKHGLSLSAEEQKKIEDDLNELVLTDGGGSKNALNSVLAEYGVNYDMMREHYTNKLKISAVQNYLYSLVGESIKEQYLNDHYVHFQQIFLANYNYVYTTDEAGDVIYYDADNKPCYKETIYKETRGGETVYFTDATMKHISYDTENGTPSPKINEAGTGYVTTPKSKEELEALDARAALLGTQLKVSSELEFETVMQKESDDPAAVKTYTDGYYLLKAEVSNPDYGDAYSLILSALDKMEVGDVSVVESDAGYHIIKKYKNTEKAYQKEENKVWFERFASNLTAEIYREECAPYLDSVKVDTELLASARNMKQVPVNYFYY